MTYDPQILILGIPLIALGVYLDRLLLKRHKVWLHDRLLRTWLRIEDTTFPDLARNLAHAIAGRFSAKYKGWKLVTGVVLGSWLLTSAAGSVGTFMEGRLGWNPYEWLPIFPVYFVVGIFFALAMLLTYWSLRLIDSAKIAKILVVLAGNAVAGLGLSLASVPFLAWSSNHAYTHNWPGSGDTVYLMFEGLLGMESELYEYFLDDAAKHFRDHPNQPFVFEDKNWVRVDKHTGYRYKAESISIRIGPLKPGISVDQWIAFERRYGRVDKIPRDGFIAFTPTESFFRYALYTWRQLLVDFKGWDSRIEGSLFIGQGEMRGSSQSMKVDQGRWPILAVASTVALPGLIFGTILGVLAAAQALRALVAAATKLFLERVTEEDPS